MPHFRVNEARGLGGDLGINGPLVWFLQVASLHP